MHPHNQHSHRIYFHKFLDFKKVVKAVLNRNEISRRQTDRQTDMIPKNV